MTLSAADFNWSGASPFSGGNPITLNTDASRTLNFTTSIGGFGSLSKTGAGTVLFNGLVANAGTITMVGGTIRLPANNRIQLCQRQPKRKTASGRHPCQHVSGDHFEFIFRRTTRSLYLDPSVHHSTTLEAPWIKAVHGVGGVTISTSPLDLETDEVTVRVPMAGAPRRFGRLEVSVP